MTKSDKFLDKMRNNPRDWQIKDLEVVAARFGISVRQGKGSHVIFSHPKWGEDMLPVPAKRPIKPIYIKRFVSLIETLEDNI